MWRHLLNFWVCSLSRSYSLTYLWQTVTFPSWKLSFELAHIISVSHHKLQTESKSEFASRHSLLYVHCFWNKVPWWSTGSGGDFAPLYAFFTTLWIPEWILYGALYSWNTQDINNKSLTIKRNPQGIPGGALSDWKCDSWSMIGNLFRPSTPSHLLLREICVDSPTWGI